MSAPSVLPVATVESSPSSRAMKRPCDDHESEDQPARIRPRHEDEERAVSLWSLPLDLVKLSLDYLSETPDLTALSKRFWYTKHTYLGYIPECFDTLVYRAGDKFLRLDHQYVNPPVQLSSLRFWVSQIEWLPLAPHLKSLILAGCCVTLEDTSELAAAFKGLDLGHVETLSLADNKLSGAQILSILTGVTSWASLKNLDLSNNCLRADDLRALAQLLTAEGPLAQLGHRLQRLRLCRDHDDQLGIRDWPVELESLERAITSGCDPNGRCVALLHMRRPRVRKSSTDQRHSDQPHSERCTTCGVEPIDADSEQLRLCRGCYSSCDSCGIVLNASMISDYECCDAYQCIRCVEGEPCSVCKDKDRCASCCESSKYCAECDGCEQRFEDSDLNDDHMCPKCVLKNTCPCNAYAKLRYCRACTESLCPDCFNPKEDDPEFECPYCYVNTSLCRSCRRPFNCDHLCEECGEYSDFIYDNGLCSECKDPMESMESSFVFARKSFW